MYQTAASISNCSKSHNIGRLGLSLTRPMCKEFLQSCSAPLLFVLAAGLTSAASMSYTLTGTKVATGIRNRLQTPSSHLPSAQIPAQLCIALLVAGRRIRLPPEQWRRSASLAFRPHNSPAIRSSLWIIRTQPRASGTSIPPSTSTVTNSVFTGDDLTTNTPANSVTGTSWGLCEAVHSERQSYPLFHFGAECVFTPAFQRNEDGVSSRG